LEAEGLVDGGGAPWFPWEIGIELLIADFPLCCFGYYKAWPRLGYLSGSHGVVLGDPGEKRKSLHRGSQSIFPPAYRKDLVGLWYYNLRSPLKGTSPSHPRDIESIKKDEGFSLKIIRVKIFPMFQ
jgi:hypothetical protein